MVTRPSRTVAAFGVTVREPDEPESAPPDEPRFAPTITRGRPSFLRQRQPMALDAGNSIAAARRGLVEQAGPTRARSRHVIVDHVLHAGHDVRPDLARRGRLRHLSLPTRRWRKTPRLEAHGAEHVRQRVGHGRGPPGRNRLPGARSDGVCLACRSGAPMRGARSRS